MIIRILVVDPADDNNVLVYQVPEGSRNMDLLVTLLDNAGIEHITLERPPKKPKPKPWSDTMSPVACDDQEEGAQ